MASKFTCFTSMKYFFVSAPMILSLFLNFSMHHNYFGRTILLTYLYCENSQSKNPDYIHLHDPRVWLSECGFMCRSQEI